MDVYTREPEGVEFRDLGTVSEYVEFVRGAVPGLELDEAAAVETAASFDWEDAGTVLVWRGPDGYLTRQVVYEA
jgi:hypothetical protein